MEGEVDNDEERLLNKPKRGVGAELTTLNEPERGVGAQPTTPLIRKMKLRQQIQAYGVAYNLTIYMAMYIYIGAAIQDAIQRNVEYNFPNSPTRVVQFLWILAPPYLAVIIGFNFFCLSFKHHFMRHPIALLDLDGDPIVHVDCRHGEIWTDETCILWTPSLAFYAPIPSDLTLTTLIPFSFLWNRKVALMWKHMLRQCVVTFVTASWILILSYLTFIIKLTITTFYATTDVVGVYLSYAHAVGLLGVGVMTLVIHMVENAPVLEEALKAKLVGSAPRPPLVGFAPRHPLVGFAPRPPLVGFAPRPRSKSNEEDE